VGGDAAVPATTRQRPARPSRQSAAARASTERRRLAVRADARLDHEIACAQCKENPVARLVFVGARPILRGGFESLLTTGRHRSGVVRGAVRPAQGRLSRVGQQVRERERETKRRSEASYVLKGLHKPAGLGYLPREGASASPMENESQDDADSFSATGSPAVRECRGWTDLHLCP